MNLLNPAMKLKPLPCFKFCKKDKLFLLCFKFLPVSNSSAISSVVWFQFEGIIYVEHKRDQELPM